MERFIISHSPAEGADSAVVLRPGMAHQVREAVNRDLCSGFLCIGEEQLLPCFLRAPVLRVAEAAGQSGLDGTGKHNCRFVVMLFQRIQKRAGKAEVSLHEILRILRTVHACQVEDEVR